jgi:hypothetical protein
MLEGTLSFIEGARKLVAAIDASRIDWRDVDLLPFVGIASETDALPFGEMRMHWQAAALEALEPKVTRFEIWARGIGNSPCRNLIRRFSEGEFEISYP